MKVSWKILLALGAVAIALFWWFSNPARAPRERQRRSTSTRSAVRLVAQKVALEEMPIITDFSDVEEADMWRSVDDGVMGGVSQSAFSITPQGTGVFSGELSLENNGGFASVRRDVASVNFEDVGAIALRVRGDGRPYQLRLQTETTNNSISYRAEFETAADEWIDIRLPLMEMEPVFRGRIVSDAPKLVPNEIKQLGLLLADKQPGSFKLEVDRIQIVR